jgi:hypothetical protein
MLIMPRSTPVVAAASLLLIAGHSCGIASPHADAPAGPATAMVAARPDSEFDARVRKVVADAAGRITLDSIGASREGRPLHLLRIGDERKPALFIVAGLNAMHTVGIDTALGVAAKLAADHADLLNDHTVYILPCADPDTLERLRTASPKRDGARKIEPVDDDRDGRVDEDPPADLNADGVITVMRVYDPPATSGIVPTEIIDPADPRLTKKPDKMKGETANVAILVEGQDADGDGLIAEDGPEGVDLTTNFPWKWPEFKDGAGASALCEPETRAIAQWLVTHDNVVAVLEFGPHDNLVKVPEAGRFDASGRVPEGIENEDKPYYEEISKLFKEATKMTGAPSNDPAGSLYGWAYAHLGLYSFATPVWVRPDLVKKDDVAKPAEAPKPAEGQAKPEGPSDAEIQALIAEFQSASRDQRRALFEKVRAMPEAAQEKIRAAVFPGGGPGGRGGGGPGGGRFGRGGAGGPGGAGGRPQPGAPVSDADDAKWLKYSDDSRNSEGFIPFKPFNHPQLGPVEIGGFVPGFKLNPPADEIPALVDQQTSFVAQLLSKLPSIVPDEPIVEDLGGGLWRITLRVSNTGYLPSRAAIAQKARRIPPLRVQLDLPEDRVIAGDRLTRIQSLPGAGGSRTIQWTIRGDSNSTVTAIVKAAEYADHPLTITLREHIPKAGPIPEPPPPPAEKPAAEPEKKETSK